MPKIDKKRLRKIETITPSKYELSTKYEVTNYEKSKFVVRKPAPLDSLNSPRWIIYFLISKYKPKTISNGVNKKS